MLWLGVSGDAVCVAARAAAPELFHRIELVPNMFSDHLPHMYEQAMSDLVAGMRGQKPGMGVQA